MKIHVTSNNYCNITLILVRKVSLIQKIDKIFLDITNEEPNLYHFLKTEISLT